MNWKLSYHRYTAWWAFEVLKNIDTQAHLRTSPGRPVNANFFNLSKRTVLSQFSRHTKFRRLKRITGCSIWPPKWPKIKKYLLVFTAKTSYIGKIWFYHCELSFCTEILIFLGFDQWTNTFLQKKFQDFKLPLNHVAALETFFENVDFLSNIWSLAGRPLCTRDVKLHIRRVNYVFQLCGEFHKLKRTRTW